MPWALWGLGLWCLSIAVCFLSLDVDRNGAHLKNWCWQENIIMLLFESEYGLPLYPLQWIIIVHAEIPVYFFVGEGPLLICDNARLYRYYIVVILTIFSGALVFQVLWLLYRLYILDFGSHPRLFSGASLWFLVAHGFWDGLCTFTVEFIGPGILSG